MFLPFSLNGAVSIVPTLETNARKGSPPRRVSRSGPDGDNVGLAFYPFRMLAEFLDSLDLPTDDGLSARTAASCT